MCSCCVAHPRAVNLISLHHQVKFLVYFVVFGFCAWREVEVCLVIAVVPARTAQATFGFFLV